MTDRQGVEIDYCPRCCGVWLDRGEIDKIIERESAAYGPLARREQAAPMPEGLFYPEDRAPVRDERRGDRDDDRHRDRDRDDDRGRGRYDGKDGKKKRESFLGDLFDFG